MTNNVQNLTTKYLESLLDEIEDNIIYISSQDLEEPGNILNNLIFERNKIKEELDMR